MRETTDRCSDSSRSAKGWRHAGGARVELRGGRLRTAPGNGLDTASDPRRTGSIYGFADLDDAHARVKPPDTWSTLTIRVVGQTYTVYRDGKRINRYTPSRRRGGYIGLQAHGGAQDVVAFRAIRIREL